MRRSNGMEAGFNLDAARRLALEAVQKLRWSSVERQLPMAIVAALWLGACSVDTRDPNVTAKGTLQPAAQQGTACGGSAGQCQAGSTAQGPGQGSSDNAATAVVAGSASIHCADALDCPARAPACVQSVCTCSLSADQLATDSKNCGSCANDCTSQSSSATCQQGRCVAAGEPPPYQISRSSGGQQAISSLAAAQAVSLKSQKFSLTLSTGQAPGGNGVSKSPRFQLSSGALGASQ